jgi:hypothetical protein
VLFGAIAGDQAPQNPEKNLPSGGKVTPREFLERSHQNLGTNFCPPISRKPPVVFSILKLPLVADSQRFPAMCLETGSYGGFAPHKIPKLAKKRSFFNFQKIADRKW